MKARQGKAGQGKAGQGDSGEDASEDADETRAAPAGLPCAAILH